MQDLKKLAWFVGLFVIIYFLPLANPKIEAAIDEAFKLVQWYARNHTLACVVPALFIAGAITTFLSQAAVMRYLGPQASKPVAYAVASVAGVVLAVCSCSVLPMFAGIYQLGAGLGPASAFLYSGPAINVLAVFLTARVLGWDLGLWRAVGAIGFAFVVGLGMATIFRRQEQERVAAAAQMPPAPETGRSLWQNALLLGAMIGFLIFSDWFNPGDAIVRTAEGQEVRGVLLYESHDEITMQVQETSGDLRAGDRLTLRKDIVTEIIQAENWVMDIYHIRWYLAGAMGIAVALMTWRWVGGDEFKVWMRNTWDFAKILVPLLFGGVFIVGFLSTLLPDKEIARLVGDNGLRSNLIGSVVGALFYFATLTEVPITQALVENGMARGPALALLLAGPALSLPNMLVLFKVMGVARTLAFSVIIVIVATISGLCYGAFA